jgi:hypothetical protein
MATLGDSVSTFTSALKEYYSPDVVQQLQFKDQPLLAMLARDNDFVGKPYYRIPVEFGSPAGTSRDWITASKNGKATSMQHTEFQVNRPVTYQLGYISAEVLLAGSDKVGAFMDVAVRQVDSNILALNRDNGIALYRDGFGSRGFIKTGSSVAGSTIQLDKISDAHNFEVGQRLDVVFAGNYGGYYTELGTGDGTNVGQIAANPANVALVISKINHGTGLLTFSQAVTTSIASLTGAAGDAAALMIEGDPGTITSPLAGPVYKLGGLRGWLPNVAPIANHTWYTADRSQDSRLGGLRLDASAGMPIVEAMNSAASLVRQFGGKASHMFCSFSTFTDIVNALETKVRYVDATEGEIGFRGVEIVTPAGSVEVFADINCPDSNAYMLELDSWKLCALKDPVVGFGIHGGTEINLLPYYQGDAYELRLASRLNLGCKAPSHNCNIILV